MCVCSVCLVLVGLVVGRFFFSSFLAFWCLPGGLELFLFFFGFFVFAFSCVQIPGEQELKLIVILYKSPDADRPFLPPPFSA